MTRKGKRSNNEPIAVTRRIIKAGNSYYISIPPDFLKKHNLKKGDAVPVVANTVLKVVPVKEV